MTLFSKIIKGEIPCYKIAESELFFAFLDIFPLVKGHVLVVEKTFECNRCGISVVGLEVPHAHLHLVPILSADDLNFTREKLKLSVEGFKEVQQKIIDAIH